MKLIDILLKMFVSFDSDHIIFDIMTNPELEEKLREAACFGDIDGVKELITK